MAWRAMNSLLVLRDQVNALAPNRSRASDGLVGDEAHQGTNSDHNPHYVPGVGSEIVTALDLTHDPAHGFDSYRFAEVLRLNRDKRIKYVISNHRIFSSYASGSRAAWVWGSYNGVDPHTNHVHVSVLDAAISDTRTPWDLEGFMALTDDDVRKIWSFFLGASGPNAAQALQTTYQNTVKLAASVPPDLRAQLSAILAAAEDDGDMTVTMPPEYLAALKAIEQQLDAVPTAQENADATQTAVREVFADAGTE